MSESPRAANGPDLPAADVLPSRVRRHGIALFLLLFVVYNVNLRQASSGDTLMARYVPIAILRSGTLELDGLAPIDPVRGLMLNQWMTRGHLYDSFPPIGPLLALPFYVVPVWLGVPADPRLLSNVASKLAGSSMAALSAMLLYLALARTFRNSSVAWVATLAYALATSAWSTASQGLWTHTPAVLTLSGALLLLTANRTGSAATLLAVGILARPIMLLLLPVLLSYNFSVPPGAKTKTAIVVAWIEFMVRQSLGAAVVFACGAAYNLWLFGDLTGAASVDMRNAQFTRIFGTHHFGGSLSAGVAGLLLSPNRGLFVFSPVVAFAFVGGAASWLRSPRSVPTAATRLTRLAAVGFLVVFLAYSKYLTWWAGDAFGPRYLTDVMPLAAVMLAYWLAERRSTSARPWIGRAATALFGITFAYSVFIQVVGAFCWPSTWNRDQNPPPYLRLWDWRRTEIVTCLREGPRYDPIARRLLLMVGIDPPHHPAE